MSKKSTRPLLKDILCDDKFSIKLSKLVGKEIKDVVGFIHWNDDDSLSFRINAIHFTDGTRIFLSQQDSELDGASVTVPEQLGVATVPNLDSDTLQAIYESFEWEG